MILFYFRKGKDCDECVGSERSTSSVPQLGERIETPFGKKGKVVRINRVACAEVIVNVLLPD